MEMLNGQAELEKQHFRKKQMLYQPANLEVWRVKCYGNLRLE